MSFPTFPGVFDLKPLSEIDIQGKYNTFQFWNGLFCLHILNMLFVLDGSDLTVCFKKMLANKAASEGFTESGGLSSKLADFDH